MNPNIHSVPVTSDEDQVWPPRGLPDRLGFSATVADLIRQDNDWYLNGAAGVCLGSSAFVSYVLLSQSVTDHQLVRGTYSDANGEHAHWWIEADEWIIDSSRGQFDQGEAYRESVVPATDSSYSVIEKFQPGHKDLDSVQAELFRCFSNESEAVGYLNQCLSILDSTSNLELE